MGQYDPVTKFLIERYAADWLAAAGIVVGRRRVRVVDADLATVTAAPDKLVRVGSGRRGLVVHIDVQVGRDPRLDDRMHLYHVPARWRHRLPVRTVVFALRPSAVPPGVTGRVLDVAKSRRARLEFVYDLIEVWRTPAERFLAGGVGAVPMAAIAAVAKGQLPEVVRHIRRRIDAELPAPDAADVWAATGILIGARYNRAVVQTLIERVQSMTESVVYRDILNKGRVEGRVEGRVDQERTTILRLGSQRFGVPDASVVEQLTGIEDVRVLDDITGRPLTATSWDRLLDG